MKHFTKVALGALMLAGAATVSAAPASAGVVVGIAHQSLMRQARSAIPIAPITIPTIAAMALHMSAAR